MRNVFSAAKCDVLTDCISMGVHIARRLRGRAIDMNAYLRKVVAEALLHVLPQFWIQWPAVTRKRLVYTGGCLIRLIAASSYVALDRRCCLPNIRMSCRCQHLVGNPICFLFVEITWLINPEFRLKARSFLFAAVLALPS